MIKFHLFQAWCLHTLATLILGAALGAFTPTFAAPSQMSPCESVVLSASASDVYGPTGMSLLSGHFSMLSDVLEIERHRHVCVEGFILCGNGDATSVYATRGPITFDDQEIMQSKMEYMATRCHLRYTNQIALLKLARKFTQTIGITDGRHEVPVIRDPQALFLAALRKEPLHIRQRITLFGIDADEIGYPLISPIRALVPNVFALEQEEQFRNFLSSRPVVQGGKR
jgi:hypothetical protein